jgi:hypothetical protein
MGVLAFISGQCMKICDLDKTVLKEKNTQVRNDVKARVRNYFERFNS